MAKSVTYNKRENEKKKQARRAEKQIIFFVPDKQNCLCSSLSPT